MKNTGAEFAEDIEGESEPGCRVLPMRPGGTYLRSMIKTYPDAAQKQDRRPVTAMDRLNQARARAAPMIEVLARTLREGSPADLERDIPLACRELDLLFQALGRVTQP